LLLPIDAPFDCKSVMSNELDETIDKLPAVSSCLDDDGECEDGVMSAVSRGSSV
jgi:hypothetical protein